MRELRVTQVCHRYYPHIGGVETHVQQISEKMAEQGYEVEVLTTDPTGELPEEEEINNVVVRRFKSWAPQNSIFQSASLRRYLQSNTFDVLHAHNYHALPALYAAKARKRLFIFTPHYHGASQSFLRNLLLYPYRFWGRGVFKQAEWVICVSNYEKQLIRNHFTLCVDKLITIPNGVNLSEFRRHRSMRNPKRLLYVGRLEEYKGVQHIIRALTQLRDYHLTIIGGGVYEAQLKRLSCRLGVDVQITWCSDVEREELLRAYESAGVFVMPSRFEAYGITVAEALAAGLPCIVAQNSALEEFVDDETCLGIDVERRDVSSQIVRAVRRLEGRRAARRHDAVLDWREVAERILSVYRGDVLRR
jgi:glycosyltransferase involved in cell wall biosynthesis